MTNPQTLRSYSGTNQARRGTKCNVPGLADGETGDFKGLTLSHSSPVIVGSRGFSLESRPRRIRVEQADMSTTKTHFNFRVAKLPARPPKPPPPRPPKPPPPPPAPTRARRRTTTRQPAGAATA